MIFVTVRELKSTKVWEELQSGQELVLTRNGKPIAVITPVHESNLKETLSAVRRVRALSAVQRLQAGSRRHGLSQMSIDEIDAEIADSRKN